MESCRLPVIELCEVIMDALVDNDRYSKQREWQSTLYACALTCRAWRARAQHLLWHSPKLMDNHRVAQFSASARDAPKSLTNSIILAGKSSGRRLDLAHASALFMHPFPNLRLLICDDVRFDRAPSPRLLRLRLPFFASLVALELWDCLFQSLRAMLDVVWAFPNLTSLKMLGCIVGARPAATVGALLASACVHLRACQKLTQLEIDWTSIALDPSVPIPGSVFGSAVTTLHIWIQDAESLNVFLRGSFPTLHSIDVEQLEANSEEQPAAANEAGTSWLHAISATRTVPSALKHIQLTQINITKPERDEAWCEEIVGRRDDAGALGAAPKLPGLEGLTIRVGEWRNPEVCAAHLRAALPDLWEVVRIERHALSSGDWELYREALTLPGT